MKKLLIVAIVGLFSTLVAFAQNPGVTTQGAVTSGNCVKFVNRNLIADNGAACFGGAASFANPSASVGLVAINGTALTAMRSDAAPALAQNITPTWTGQHVWVRGVSGYTPTGDAGLEVAVDGDTYNVTQLTAFSALSAAGDGPFVFGRFSYGTPTSKVAVDSGAVLLALAGTGWNSAAFPSTKVRISLNAAETWTASANGTQIDFFTTPTGSTTAAASLRYTPAGNLNFLSSSGVTFGGTLSASVTSISSISNGVVGIGTGAIGSVAGSTSAAGYYVGGTTNIGIVGADSTNGITQFAGVGGVRAIGLGPTVGGTNAVMTMQFISTGQIGWSSGSDPRPTTGTLDAILTRCGVACIQHGAASAAAPITQSIATQGSRAGTDSNTAGGNLFIGSGQGTGTGFISSIFFQTPLAAAAGVTAQTMTTGWTINKGVAASTGYTIANLPTAPLTGSVAYVTNQAVACAAAGAGLTAGGAIVCPVFYNGTAWVGN